VTAIHPLARDLSKDTARASQHAPERRDGQEKASRPDQAPPSGRFQTRHE
jgi:hypothetical protein